jgi:hypothetical protein
MTPIQPEDKTVHVVQDGEDIEIHEDRYQGGLGAKS